MRTSLTTLIIFALFCAVIYSEEQDAYQSAYAKWELAAFGDGSKQKLIDVFDELNEAWKNAPQSSRTDAAYYYASAAIKTARHASNEDAFRLLGEAANVTKEFPIVVSRGKSSSRFRDVASVHARVWGKNGSDPFAGADVGYEMFPLGQSFYALQESADIEQTTVVDTESLPAENEQLGLLLQLDLTGAVLQNLPVAITKGSGSLRSRLSRIYEQRATGPNGPSRYIKHEAETYLAGQNGATKRPKGSSRVSLPAGRQPLAPKGPDAKPAQNTQSKETTSSTFWATFMLLIVAVTGLLSLLMKKRK